MVHNVLLTESNFPAVNIADFGYEDCEKSHHFGPAVRTYWLLHFVESGFGVFKIGDKTYNLKPGEIFVIPPFVETYYEADRLNPWSYIWIAFTCDGEPPCSLSDTVYCPEALGVFEGMKQCENLAGGKNAFLLARLWELFSLLCESQKHDDDYISMALSAIHTEYMQDISVSSIAKRLSLDRSYFSTLFKERTGLSPGQYLFNYRMTQAAFFMTEGGQSVSTAANSVGYNDIYNFSRMFKRHFGISPREYIKKHRV